MVALIIIGIILAIIVLIMLIPVGADAAYEEGKLKISGKLCGFLVQLYPSPPEEKKEEKPKKPKEKEDEEKKKPGLELPPFNREEMLELARAGLSAVGNFGRKLKVSRFLLHVVVAGDDPYKTAVSFGYLNAALDTLAPICSRRFTVKDLDVRTDVDFTKDKPELDFGLAMTIRIGQIFAIGIATGVTALKIRKKCKKRIAAQEAAAKPETEDSVTVSNTEINDTENIQAEERNDANG